MVLSLVIFFSFFLVGFAFPIFFREKIFDFMANLVGSLEGLNTWEVMGFIFFNNLKASFFALLFGIGFGVFPIITGVINGYLVGFVAREAARVEGILVLWRLLPHGIFELPAVFFCIGMGMKIGFSLFGKKNTKNNLKRNLKESLRFFAFVVIPLLIIAGIIEGILVSSTM
jgi:stage II sporulation protein M